MADNLNVDEPDMWSKALEAYLDTETLLQPGDEEIKSLRGLPPCK